LVRELFAKNFANPIIEEYGDSAVLDFTKHEARGTNSGSLAFTTDSYVVRPIEFPGGDIGKLAVCGTVNDLAVSGAQPLWLSCSFIIEEGFEIDRLEQIIKSMAEEAKKAGVDIACGDTKVVEHGTVDGLFINTSGIGRVITKTALSPNSIKPGDRILLSGTIADHGIAIMAARKDISFETPITSDCASLNSLTKKIIEAAPNVRCMRDPTRGGVAASLNEWIESKPLGIEINENDIPIQGSTMAICEMLGFDPLTVANEGKALVAVPAEECNAAIEAICAHPLGKAAKVIGEATSQRPGKVVMNTSFGSSRIVPMPSGELLPRIC
jgi:hydrogenase expression/formation protein HypE